MELGQHCSFAPCNRLDFLPFECSKCCSVFCKDHRTPSSHECQSDTLGEDQQQVSSTRVASTSYHCSLEGCRRKELVDVSCPQCCERFCLAHRHPEDHACPELNKDTQPPPSQRQYKGGRKESKEKQKALSQGTISASLQTKVVLMKMKMKAEGSDSIPQAERVYFEVQLPEEFMLSSKPMFFSKEWSVGKIVDSIATKFKLRNENDNPSANKLLLYTSSGEALVMSETLKNLLETTPIGSTVKLDYQYS